MTDPIFQSDTMALAQKFLDAAALRQQAIASNLANVETPGYKRVDLASNFAEQLKESLSSGNGASQASGVVPKLVVDSNARSVRADGNNVDIDKELLAMDNNAMNYEYLSDVVTHNIKQIKMAITGNI
jgi:flagellar basal-body rod protein FlgB